MQVWPRAAGFGITASPLITQLCELAGIKDVTIKVTGRRRNIRNVVQTFVEGLLSQSVPHDGVEGSGVYMREVWMGRQLPCGLKRGVHVP
jgi:small subunit ribosomal protein S5